MSPASWEDDGPGIDPGPVNRLELPAAGSRWPATLAGYAKVLAAALGSLTPGAVIVGLNAAGITNIPPWVQAAITLVVTVCAVLFSKRNQT